MIPISEKLIYFKAIPIYLTCYSAAKLSLRQEAHPPGIIMIPVIYHIHLAEMVESSSFSYDGCKVFTRQEILVLPAFGSVDCHSRPRRRDLLNCLRTSILSQCFHSAARYFVCGMICVGVKWCQLQGWFCPVFLSGKRLASWPDLYTISKNPGSLLWCFTGDDYSYT
jgi:hypothetical protein